MPTARSVRRPTRVPSPSGRRRTARTRSGTARCSAGRSRTAGTKALSSATARTSSPHLDNVTTTTADIAIVDTADGTNAQVLRLRRSGIATSTASPPAAFAGAYAVVQYCLVAFSGETNYTPATLATYTGAGWATTATLSTGSADGFVVDLDADADPLHASRRAHGAARLVADARAHRPHRLPRRLHQRWRPTSCIPTGNGTIARAAKLTALTTPTVLQSGGYEGVFALSPDDQWLIAFQDTLVSGGSFLTDLYLASATAPGNRHHACTDGDRGLPSFTLHRRLEPRALPEQRDLRARNVQRGRDQQWRPSRSVGASAFAGMATTGAGAVFKRERGVASRRADAVRGHPVLQYWRSAAGPTLMVYAGRRNLRAHASEDRGGLAWGATWRRGQRGSGWRGFRSARTSNAGRRPPPFQGRGRLGSGSTARSHDRITLRSRRCARYRVPPASPTTSPGAVLTGAGVAAGTTGAVCTGLPVAIASVATGTYCPTGTACPPPEVAGAGVSGDAPYPAVVAVGVTATGAGRPTSLRAASAISVLRRRRPRCSVSGRDPR